MGSGVHYDIAGLLHRLCNDMLAHREDDTKLLRLLSKTYSAVLCCGSKDTTQLFTRKVRYALSCGALLPRF